MKNTSLNFIVIFQCILLLGCTNNDRQKKSINPEDKTKWVLSWSDEFNYNSRESLLENWNSREGHSGNPLVLSSSWKENIEVDNGVLKLVAKKENKLNDLQWTAASIWTNKKFQFGYFECRYKYAAAGATNNSFWLMPDQPNSNKDYEIDINEGNYPDKVNTNVHIYTDKEGVKMSPISQHYNTNFSEGYHTFGLEWDDDELIWYLDRREIRREKNTACFSETPIILSLAIVTWLGNVTDAIDGKYMEVDYVKVYKSVRS